MLSVDKKDTSYIEEKDNDGNILKFIKKRRAKNKMKENIFERITNLLKSKEKYVSDDGELLKAKVYSDIMTMDQKLLALLLSDDEIKKVFFVKIDDTLVFDKQKFTWIIDSKDFLPDSYTAYTNKIGLTSNGDFISQKNDVVLDFPYKDCVLEGGQTKEDQKRKEIFYNETLASSEIIRMLDPKVFTKAKRYTKDGVEENIKFDEKDNLIIKGNNLIALSSLLKRYEGKVKCIYIDPPYNTGSDSFNYNDNFSRSTWLTFMENRLKLAKKLLKNDGVILVSIDEKQQAYLKVLMDEIFGNENILEVFHLQVRYTNKSLNEKDDFQPVMEYVLAYALDKKSFKPNKPFAPYDIKGFTNEIKELSKGETLEIEGRKVTIFKKGEWKRIVHKEAKLELLKPTWITGSIYSGTGHGTVYQKVVEPRYDVDGYGSLYKVYGLGEDGLGYRYMRNPNSNAYTKGEMFSGVPMTTLEEIKKGTAKKYSPIVNYYDYSPDFGNIRHEGGVSFNSGKKPEKMLKCYLIFQPMKEI